MKYKSLKEMKNKHREMIDGLPIKWAFSEEQFKKILQEWNVTVEDCKAFPAGGIIRKSDEQMILSAFHQIREEEKEFRKDRKNLVETFVYAMMETEFGYTHDEEAVLDYCGYELSDFWGAVKSAFDSAKKKYLKNCV